MQLSAICLVVVAMKAHPHGVFYKVFGVTDMSQFVFLATLALGMGLSAIVLV